MSNRAPASMRSGSGAFPKRLGHIWIGDRPAPTDWMKSWSEAHPDWEYVLYDNDYLMSRRWRSQILINEYFSRRAFAGVSDLMRYEILLEQGGFLPEADSICKARVDELFVEETVYSVYENEAIKPGFVTPYLASVPEHPTVERTLQILLQKFNKRPEKLRKPWRSVGNKFLKALLEGEDLEITIFPSHYFNPQHKTKDRYEGDGPVYAEQLWGSTMGRYDNFDPETQARIHAETLAALHAKLEVPHADG